MNRIAVAAALLCAGCGNYSTEDLRFLSALPTREDLKVAVAAQASAGAATVCATRPADLWLKAKPTSDNLNAGVSAIVGLVDLVRRYPPTWRHADERRWGPFDAEKHPGREIQILMWRTYPSALAGAPRYDYRFQARWKGTPDFTNIIAGFFDGDSASQGNGSFTLAFQSLWDLQMNEKVDDPHGTVVISYSRASDPVTIDLDLTQPGFGVPSFYYQYAGYADRRGAFTYRFHDDGTGNEAVIESSYDAAAAGWARVTFTYSGATSPAGEYRQCWDASACLVYVDDPLNLSCTVVPPATSCSLGTIADCPPDVPVKPF